MFDPGSWRGCATCTEWMKARDAAKYLTEHRTNYPGQTVNSTKVKKFWIKSGTVSSEKTKEGGKEEKNDRE
jgi:hypothetical protein